MKPVPLLARIRAALLAARDGRPLGSVETKVMGSFLISIIMLGFGAALINQAGESYTRSARWVARAQEVRTVLSRLDANVSEAALAFQGFLHNGDPVKLQQWSELTGVIGAQQKILVELTTDDPEQTRRLAALAAPLARFLGLLDQGVTLFNQARFETARELIYSGQGLADRQAIRRQIDAMHAAEQVSLDARQAALARDRQWTLAGILLTLLIEVVLLALVFWSIRSEMVARRRAELALVQAKEAADSANRAKSTFLATMSHEIRTPMNGVLGLLELLSLSRLQAEQRATLAIVRESGDALLRIIDDILDFSKIEAGKLDVLPVASRIGTIVEDVKNMYSGNASSKGLLLLRWSDPGLSPALLVDPVRLRQILNNFVSNAIKFTERGEVEVRAELVERSGDREQVRFTVRDTGIGISEQDRLVLFQPFNQVAGDAASRAGGTGLGLTICRRLATLMGGTVDMASQPGQGTTMALLLTLPIADPADLQPDRLADTADAATASAGIRRAAPSVDQAELEGTLVLLVDDHPTNRLLVLRQVNALGYAGESVEDGLLALEKWRSGRFGLVITDCNMPVMDGYELTRRIRALEAGRAASPIPIVACTAYAIEGEAAKCLAAGMSDYLAKPIVLAQLQQTLEQWLPIPPAAVAPVAPASQGAEAGPAAAGLATSTAAAAAAAAAGAGAVPAPLDLSLIAQISGGNAVQTREILQEFRRINDQDAIQLRTAVEQNDAAWISSAVHRMLGSSRMVGAQDFATACEGVEESSRAGDSRIVAEGMQAFEQQRLRLNAYIESVGSRNQVG